VEIRNRWSTKQDDHQVGSLVIDVAGIVASVARRFSVASPMEEVGSIVATRYQIVETAGATMR
jgi:hypothetical protein